MRILLLITQYELAGAQKVTLALADYFHRHNHTVSVVFLYDKHGTLSDLQFQKEYSVVDMRMKDVRANRIINLWYFVSAIVRLFLLMRSFEPHVVQTMTHYSNIIGLFLAWLAGVPVRISSQRSSLKYFPNWFLYVDSVWANSCITDQMVVVSKRVANFCIDIECIEAEKVTTIANGVNISVFQRRTLVAEAQLLREQFGWTDKFVILTIGRLDFQKGHLYLLDAIAELAPKYPKMHFVWVGDGDMRDELQKAICEQGLIEHVSILGVRRDIPRLLTLADLFVLPSLFEGMPNVVLEAMAANCPVIATNVEGTNELVTNRKTGVLVPPESSDALLEAIEILYFSPSMREQFGRAGLERVKCNYTVLAMCDHFLMLYEHILASKNQEMHGNNIV